MNQDQIKSRLLQVEATAVDFTVLLTGKESKKVDGLYNPETKEIIIHNKNHPDDNSLMYTALHEYAHHLQYEKLGTPASPRVHNTVFRDIFYRLIDRAEELSVYRNSAKHDSRLVQLTDKIKGHILSQNGQLMLEFGGLLMEAHKLCGELRIHFEDYCDRTLGLRKHAARQLMSVFKMNVNPDVGYENMKLLASIKDPGERSDAERAIREGMSPESIDVKYRSKPLPENRLEALMAEKDKTEQSIQRLLKKLAFLEEKIIEMKNEN